MVIELIKLIKKNQIQENIFILEFESSKICEAAKPGQFVNILIENFTLRRPFTIFETRSNKFKIGVKIKGAGTKKLISYDEGKIINALGPLGHGFLMPRPSDKVLLIGGGVGCFALFELAKHCNFCYTVLGFRTSNQLILQNEFKEFGPVTICVEDGSYGQFRLVTEPLETLIKAEQISRIACCGPMPMMEAVFKIAKKFNILCEICLEERMACGFGACLGCHCEVKKHEKIQSKHVCCDGPVFDAREVFFN